ncbi:hypothetical protein ILUMI_05043 [Ignelater luminosus]|uniref:furin n=1 Tax=Ignelater luminosus TaxID=2038154 RepID=A0A8K0DCP4_IGNLU|nr:hypothetical protein ILUMI_05043 [Ignelater luminosus]
MEVFSEPYEKSLTIDLSVSPAKVRGFRNTYLLVPMESEYPTHSKRGMVVSKRLIDDSRVLWADTQQIKQRQKRDYQKLFEELQIPLVRSRRLKDDTEVVKRPPIPVYDRTFNDELWTQEWYMQDTRTRPDLPKLDLNVLPVYRAGITGKGVKISILDDGIEYTHEDLKTNYDPDISWDCNEDDNDPFPRYDPTHQNSHGTRCAGEIAMIANNGKCGVGIAFNAKVGGVKLLDGLVNDRIEGTALGFAHDIVDIYSASWGPNDDGKTVDGPGRLANEALTRGVTEGRGGKGSIYVWASGNGGDRGDNCNCDGYLASPYTISIGSASQRGEFPWYGEACASTVAVTYSSGAYQDQMIATTDLHNQCTIKHTGTSASAPLAAGIVALALEANPNLTWRDVQHLIVWSSEIAPVADNPGWQKNAAGLWFNTRFGFGLMNAFGLVRAAVNWTTVPPKAICVVKPYPLNNNTISYGNPVTLTFETTGCKGTQQEVRYLEHVEVRTTIHYSIRGVLEIYLTSPAGTQVQILNKRKLDDSTKGFKDWTFMSVTTWGELAQGIWTVTVIDNVGPESNTGSVENMQINLHGTVVLPNHMKHGARNYNHDYNRVHNRVGKAQIKYKERDIHDFLSDLANGDAGDYMNKY